MKESFEGGGGLKIATGTSGGAGPNGPDERDLLGFEARVTVALGTFPVVVVCAYDVGPLPRTPFSSGRTR